MDKQRVDELKAILSDWKETVDEQAAKRLELDKGKRIIDKLDSFSTDCEECKQHFADLEAQFKDRSEQDYDLNAHKKRINKVVSHLQDKHDVVTSGYYLSLYLSIGTALGMLFGLLLLDNIALGLPIGTGIGITIGAGLDSDAKKKGLVL